MARREFTNAVKNAAYERSGGRCEGVGELYGLPKGQRCNADLRRGVIYDHRDPVHNSDDASLENCDCLCPDCNRYKTGKRDIPMIAKTKRQRNKDRGIRRPSNPMPGSRKSKFKRKMNGEVVLGIFVKPAPGYVAVSAWAREVLA